MRDVNFIVLLLCNLFLRAQQAYFSSKPDGVIKAIIGQNVTFNWNYTVEDGESVLLMQLDYSETYQFENSAKRIGYKLLDGEPAKGFRKNVHVARTGALTLYNVTVDDQGFYKCAVSFRNKAYPLSDKTQLLVGLPPVIRSFPKSHEIELLEDSHVDMKCEASGIPVPNVSWYREIEYGWEKLSEGNLRIKNAQLSDSGLYKCGATNFMGSEEKTVKLVVYERPIVTSFFHTAALDNTVYECETITFTCEAGVSSPPVKSIYIYHEDRLVHRSLNVNKPRPANKVLAVGSRTGQLIIAKVRKGDEGRYYCVAENERGSGYNKTIDLKVFAAPKNCERKRTLETARTTIRPKTPISTTVSDHTLTTTTATTTTSKKHNVLGSHSHSQVTRPCLLLIAVAICHFMLNCMSS